MDLRYAFPRSMRDKLEGYVHLGRMIDKCRAVLAGTEGDYIYPCPIDARLLEFAAVTDSQFTQAVAANPTDEGVARWFRAMATAHTPGEIDQWNQMLLTIGPNSSESQAHFNRLRDAVDPTRTDVTAWADLQDLEEGRPVPARERVA